MQGKLKDEDRAVVLAIGTFMVASGNALLRAETYEELVILGQDRDSGLNAIEELAKHLGVTEDQMGVLLNQNQ